MTYTPDTYRIPTFPGELFGINPYNPQIFPGEHHLHFPIMEPGKQDFPGIRIYDPIIPNIGQPSKEFVWCQYNA